MLRLPPQLTTCLCHRFPSSPLPIVTTTSHRHHLPSSTSLPHHFPSSPLPIVPTSLPHHFPSSPPPFVTTLCHSFLILCDVPPFIKVNSIDSYSFVLYCYVMYCFVIYHPSSRSIPPLLILLLCIVMLCTVRSRTTLHHSQFHQVKVIRTRKYCFPTSFNFFYSLDLNFRSSQLGVLLLTICACFWRLPGDVLPTLAQASKSIPSKKPLQMQRIS